jgi:hypothetical protein
VTAQLKLRPFKSASSRADDEVRVVNFFTSL